MEARQSARRWLCWRGSRPHEAGLDVGGQFRQCRDALCGLASGACGVLEAGFSLLEGMGCGSGVGRGLEACFDQAGVGEDAGDDGVLLAPLFELVGPLLEQDGGSQCVGRFVAAGEAGAAGRLVCCGECVVVAGFGVCCGLCGGHRVVEVPGCAGEVGQAGGEAGVAGAGVVEGAGELCLLLGQGSAAGLALGQQVSCFLVQSGAGVVFAAEAGEVLSCGGETGGGVAGFLVSGVGVLQGGGEFGGGGGRRRSRWPWRVVRPALRARGRLW